MTSVRVKVCCIASAAEAQMAIDAGAAALGLVSAMPSGPGPISDAEIADIARQIPPGVASFLLTASQDPDAIVAQQRRCGVNTIQLVDRLSAEVHRALRRRLPGIALVQVVHVGGPQALAEARAAAANVDAIMLDSGKPDLQRKELGGTGRVHDWDVSAAIVQALKKPVYLAGGLGPDNVAAAIERVRPFGVDLCSGLRSQGQLDEDKLRRFMTAVRGV